MNPKKVIVCDLDGTLAVSKSKLSPDMAEVIGHVLKKYMFVVVSGGAYPQFQKQFISELHVEPELLKNLYLFPANGTTCYKYNLQKKSWEQLYDEPLLPKEKKAILKAFDEVISKAKIDTTNLHGELIEDRGGQITFSALGQNAPISAKEKWDPDQKKRKKMADELKKLIPEFEVRIGGTTSIDVTKKGLDKAYAMEKIEKLLKVKDEDVIYVGDALYKGGNDETIKSTGVDFIQEDGPNSTLEFLSRFM